MSVFRGFPIVVYLHSLELKMVGVGVVDENEVVELYFSRIHPISKEFPGKFLPSHNYILPGSISYCVIGSLEVSGNRSAL